MIHVYTVNISRMKPETYDTLHAHASQNRKHRADHCRNREDAVHCIAAEALLRYALKHHLSLTSWELECNVHGKPSLKGHGDFCFNISHSGNWVVLACGATEVGIDVETVRMDDKKVRIARRFFTQKEQDYVFQNEADRDKRFFEVWTAKESYLKFLGTGLQKPLNTFCVRSMENPHFFSQWLDAGYMTLCTHEDTYHLEQLHPEQLTDTKGD